MDFFYCLGLLVFLFYLISFLLTLYADSDLLTFLATKWGKDPKVKYYKKVVWITGASSGIGEALAKELASYGAKLVLSARRKEELERVKKECLQTNGALKSEDILVLPLDVTEMSSHEPAFKAVLKTFGKLDTFISNAGQGQVGDWWDIDMSVDRHMFELNVFSVVNMNRIVVKYFLQNGGGQVGVVSSLSGKASPPLTGPYAGAKHAIHGYFNSLRMETMGKNIDVTIICPGLVATPIFKTVLGLTSEKVSSSGKQPGGILAMTPERCAYLSLVALANGLTEAWTARLPSIPFLYLYTYHPLLADLFAKLTIKQTIELMRKME